MNICQQQPEPSVVFDQPQPEATCLNCEEFINCSSSENDDDDYDNDCLSKDYRAGMARRRRVRRRDFISRASTVGLPKGDTKAEAANEKISKEAKELIKAMYKRVNHFFVALKMCPCKIDHYDFTNVGDLVKMIQEMTSNMVAIAQTLKYSPFITELTDLCDEMGKIVAYVEELPALVYVRLVDITFCLHEYGALLQEVLLPIDFAFVIQKIHTHLRKLTTYGVLKQVVFVPMVYDPIVAPYSKDARLRRLELMTNCRITMIRPDDRRAAYCPVNFRTIEVEFNLKNGRYLGFAHLLNRCITSRTSEFLTRGSDIVVKHFASNTLHKLNPSEVEPLRQRLSRTMLSAVESDMTSGTKVSAVVPEKKLRNLVK